MELTTSQRAALDTILAGRDRCRAILSLAGPAGTGKTTVLHFLRDAIDETVEAWDTGAVVVTPTNKAAAVLRGKGVKDAATLYATFFMPIEEPGGKIRFEPNDVWSNNGRRALPDGKLHFADTIIVDEASMLQTWLISHLRRMCHTLILVGDPHQLPPVNDRANPAGFFCSREHDAVLTEVLRQGAGSPILELATHIREGRMPEGLLRTFAPGDTFAGWYDGSQKIIAFTNRNRQAINTLARQVLGRKGVLPQAGDRMVSNSNLTDQIFNGTEFEIAEFRWRWNPSAPTHLAGVTARLEDGSTHDFVMDMTLFLADQSEGTVPAEILRGVGISKAKARDDGPEGASCGYGYCITGHKSQGSEWPEVCVVDERWVLGKMDPGGDLSRRFNYTVVTRAQERLVFANFAWFKTAARQGVAA